MKNRMSFNMSTVMYFTVLGVFLVLQYFNGGLTFEMLFLTFIVTSVPYLFFTRKFYLVVPAISVFALMFTIATLPSSVYLITGEEPSFVMFSSVLAFLLTLLMSNQVSHAEWSIKSPWVANILGLIGLYSIEMGLLMKMEGVSQIIIGTVGFLAFMLISVGYITSGQYVTINKPTSLTPDSLDKSLTASMYDSMYLHVKGEADSQDEVTVLDSKSRDGASYRLYFTNDTIYYDSDSKPKRQFKVMKDKKAKMLYSWLLQQSIKSKEIKKTKEIKTESLIVVTIDERYSDGLIETWDIPIPRTSKTNVVGHLIIDGKDNDKFIDKLTELTVELSLKENGYG